MRRRRLNFVLVIAVSVLLSGCQWNPLTSLNPSGATVAVAVELVGPEYLYPLVDARVGLNERIQQTSTTGQASFSDVPKDEVVRVTASTDFTSVTQ